MRNTTGQLLSLLTLLRQVKFCGFACLVRLYPSLLFFCCLGMSSVYANELKFISFSEVEGEGLEVKLTFTESVDKPKPFETTKPPRIALDFLGAQNNLPWTLPMPVEIGGTLNIRAVESEDRTRVLINLEKMVPYNIVTDNNIVYVTLQDDKLQNNRPGQSAASAAQTSRFNPGRSGSSGATLKDIKFAALPGDRVQIVLSMAGNISEPTGFTVDEPARIALDFPNTKNELPWRSRRIGIGMVKSVAAIEAGGRTRVVINLVKPIAYDTKVDHDKIVLTMGAGVVESQPVIASSVPGGALSPVTDQHGVEQVDFRRGVGGEGRIVVTFADPSVLVDIREEGGRIIADFINTTLPTELEQRLDVIDFATPVQTIDTFVDGDNVRLVIEASGKYEHLAYQSNNLLTIDVKPVLKRKEELAKKNEYTGEKLSLNFQDIEVRAVLQLLADFTSLNVVVSDSVQGSITLRLKNVPWDHALDIILKSKGLAMRRNGNVMLVAPGDEIAAREKLELESRKQISELAPLRSELVQINYAKGSELATLLKSDNNTLLSERGNVTVDERTNTLLIRDTAGRLREIRQLISELDIPIRQVLIESRIVIASDNFVRDLGVKLGLQSAAQSGNNTFMSAGNIGGLNAALGVPSALNDSLNVNLPANALPGSLALGILTNDVLLGLELSALQVENRGEVVSNPRVITSNQKEALIEQGTEIPYLTSTSSGATSVSFKKAVLSLRVTPQITPDDRVILDLQVSKDSVGVLFGPTNVPSIETKEVSTQVLVDNGETVVLGGIYEQENNVAKTKIPLLGDIPLIGVLFRSTNSINNKKELLIFVTPKILKDTLKIK